MLALLCLRCLLLFTDDIIPSESSSLSDTTTYDDGMMFILFFPKEFVNSELFI